LSRPLSISIVTPSLNQAGTIEETIRSVQDQDYSDFEHYVIDGGSNDGTVDILERHQDLLWISEPDRGQSHAINKGMHRARGDVVAYLNADDCYRPGAFSAVARAFADPYCYVLVGRCDIIDPKGDVIGVFEPQLDSQEDLLRWWQWGDGFCLPQPAMFWRRAAMEAVGLFDPTFDMAMDLEMWMRLAKMFPFTLTETTLAAYRQTPETKTSRRRADMVLDCDRAARTHIDLAPPKSRGALVRELDRHAAGALLTIAEDLRDRATLRKALAYSSTIAASTRFWRTLIGA
jgi:cellulose synthase/poly-beta-1,6-N-acetylglucosamine synthase-like glycosyltransferase